MWGGGNKHRIHGSLRYNSVFRVCYITSIDVDVILDTCSTTIEIIVCYHKYVSKRAWIRGCNYRTSSWHWVNSICYSEYKRKTNPEAEKRRIVVEHRKSEASLLGFVVVVVAVVFTLKAVPISTQYFLTSVLVQLTRTPSVVTG